MSNKGKNNGFTPEELLRGLEETAIGLPIDSIVFRPTTTELGNAIVEVLQSIYHIPEADHCFLLPRRDNNGVVRDFSAMIAFKLGTRSGVEPTIWKVGNRDENNGGRRRDNRINFMDYAARTNSSTGGIETSKEFKKSMASIAIKDRDGNFKMRLHSKNNDIVIMECDFFAIVSILLKISNKSPYDFEIIGCTPEGKKNNQGEPVNFRLKIAKMISTNSSSRSGFNYDYIDSEFIHSNGRY